MIKYHRKPVEQPPSFDNATIVQAAVSHKTEVPLGRVDEATIASKCHEPITEPTEPVWEPSDFDISLDIGADIFAHENSLSVFPEDYSSDLGSWPEDSPNIEDILPDQCLVAKKDEDVSTIRKMSAVNLCPSIIMRRPASNNLMVRLGPKLGPNSIMLAAK